MQKKVYFNENASNEEPYDGRHSLSPDSHSLIPRLQIVSYN